MKKKNIWLLFIFFPLFRVLVTIKIPLSDGYYMVGNRIFRTCILYDSKKHITIKNIYDWMESDRYIYGERVFGYYIYDKLNGNCSIYNEKDFYQESAKLGLDYNMNANNISCYTNR